MRQVAAEAERNLGRLSCRLVDANVVLALPPMSRAPVLFVAVATHHSDLPSCALIAFAAALLAIDEFHCHLTAAIHLNRCLRRALPRLLDPTVCRRAIFTCMVHPTGLRAVCVAPAASRSERRRSYPIGSRRIGHCPVAAWLMRSLRVVSPVQCRRPSSCFYSAVSAWLPGCVPLSGAPVGGVRLAAAGLQAT